jgi:hypothetical protein
VIPERFVIDDSAFQFFDEAPSALEQSLRQFLSLLDYALRTGGGVARWSDLWHVEAESGRTLSDLLFGADIIDRDIRVLLGGRLDKVRCWDDDESLNPPPDVRFEDQTTRFSPGIGLCLSAAVAGNHAIACLTTDQSGRQGATAVTTVGLLKVATVFFLVEAIDAPAFWRNTIVIEDLDASGVASLTLLAFPHLRFAAGVWRQTSRFQGSFRDVRPQLVRDLAGLDDHAVDVWRSFAEPSRIAAEMSARCGVNCSRESSNTHGNAAAMAERRVDFDGDWVACEWHTKLEPHRNRIHFAVRGDLVCVGIFTDHLST